MFRQLRPSLLVLLVMTLMAGLAYPLLVTGLTHVVVVVQAKASPMMDGGPAIDDDGESVGSESIDVPLGPPEIFWGQSTTSGLDPRINPGAAQCQAARIARARNISEGQVRRLIAQNVEFRKREKLGEPCVNVARLNVALDAISPKVRLGR